MKSIDLLLLAFFASTSSATLLPEDPTRTMVEQRDLSVEQPPEFTVEDTARALPSTRITTDDDIEKRQNNPNLNAGTQGSRTGQGRGGQDGDQTDQSGPEASPQANKTGGSRPQKTGDEASDPPHKPGESPSTTESQDTDCPNCDRKPKHTDDPTPPDATNASGSGGSGRGSNAAVTTLATAASSTSTGTRQSAGGASPDNGVSGTTGSRGTVQRAAAAAFIGVVVLAV